MGNGTQGTQPTGAPASGTVHQNSGQQPPVAPGVQTAAASQPVATVTPQPGTAGAPQPGATAQPKPPTGPAAGGQPTAAQPDWTPEKDQAFARRLEAEKARLRAQLEAELRSQIEQEYLARIQGQQVTSAGPSPEERARFIEEVQAMWYEDPEKAFEMLADRVLGEKLQRIEAIEQQQTWNDRADEMAAKYPDFDQHVPAILEILDQHPQIANLDNAYEIAYHMAKSRLARPVGDLLQDPAIRQQILGDPSIRNEIIAAYTQEVASTRPPTVMGSQPGGMAPAAPPVSPKTVKEAGRAWRASMGGHPS